MNAREQVGMKELLEYFESERVTAWVQIAKEKSQLVKAAGEEEEKEGERWRNKFPLAQKQSQMHGDFQ